MSSDLQLPEEKVKVPNLLLFWRLSSKSKINLLRQVGPKLKQTELAGRIRTLTNKWEICLDAGKTKSVWPILKIKRLRWDISVEFNVVFTKPDSRPISMCISTARDMWKKRYFEEKKRTAPLEEKANKLRSELDMLHRRIMSHLETQRDREEGRRPRDNQPSEQVGRPFFLPTPLSMVYLMRLQKLSCGRQLTVVQTSGIVGQL